MDARTGTEHPRWAGREHHPRPVHVVWVQAGGCDGCTMATLGATHPRLEELLGGSLTRSRLRLHHPVLALDAGRGHLEPLRQAAAGELDPYLLVVEGALFDQRLAGSGSFSGLGQEHGQPIPVETWVARLAGHATAVLAIGTCATWGGIPAAAGSVTGATGLGAFLGDDYRSTARLPVINIPGCAVSGDGFIEVLQYTLLHLDGVVPLDLDDLNRPRWLFAIPTPIGPARPAIPEAPGPSRPAAGLQPQETADCPVPTRGWINRLGGCRSVGGACNGCTRPDFPDRTLPLVATTEPR